MNPRKNLIFLIFVLAGMVFVLLILNFLGVDRNSQKAEIYDVFPVKISRSGVIFFNIMKNSNRIIFYEELDSIIYEAGLDGRNKKELSRIPGVKDIDFSPDGHELAAFISERGDLKGYHFDLVENRRTVLDPRTRSAAFSPDGSRVAYYLYDDESGEGSIQVVAQDNQRQNVIFKTRLKDLDLSWPEADLIAFSDFGIRPDGSGFRTIKKTNPDSEAVIILEEAGIKAAASQVSALGDYLVYLNAKDRKLYSLKIR